MFGEFVWWQGVVEDRKDPLKLGRCRVRILGYHTDNKIDGEGIPTEHLPWAYPSQPITSAAMNGIGTTPLGAVEGTWVFGFFRDGKAAQEPVMTGTFGGIPEAVSNPSKGFNDPNGTYPLSTHLNEPDTNRLARGGGAITVPLKGSLKTKSSEDSPSLDHKRKTRQMGVPMAEAAELDASIENTGNRSLYLETEWNEPNPRYGGVKDSSTEYLASVEITSLYPHNHVRMSESGHVEEWDDTKTAERLHKFHKSGTFEEIQPDGTKVVKIVSNDYEITLGSKAVLINGTCNVTIGGDCRMLYQGDLVQEVQGDYHLHVRGEKRTKIYGNDVTEVISDRKTVIKGSDDLKVGGESYLNVSGDRQVVIKGEKSETVTKKVTHLYFSSLATVTGGNNTTISVGNIDISALMNLGLSSVLNYDRTTLGLSTTTVTGPVFQTYLSAKTTATTGIDLNMASLYQVAAGQILLN
jgi:hypothetical protein